MRVATGLAIAACAALSSCSYCSQRVMPEDEFAARTRDRPLMPEPAAAPGPAEAIRGTIERAEGAPPPEGAILFLLVRPADAAGGPPLAVQRLAAPAFPIEFEIGSADAMIPGTTFPGRVRVEARLDADGDASTETPGDEWARSEPLAPGATGVELTLAAP